MTPETAATSASWSPFANIPSAKTSYDLARPGTEAPDKVSPSLVEVEDSILEIWQDVLKTKEIGKLDNFFTVGGHSLLAINIMARLKEKFPGKYKLSILFNNPTAMGMAQEVHRQINLQIS